MPKPSYHLVPIVETRLHRVGSIRYAARDVSSPSAAVALCREFIAEYTQDRDREHFVAVGLSAKNHPTVFQVVSVGTISAALVHPREVFKAAILHNCHGLIVAHNHPSGDPTPSREDRDVTDRLARSGTLLGIELLDSLVIGADGRYSSFRQSGVLPLRT